MPRSQKAPVPQSDVVTVVTLLDKYATSLVGPDIDLLRECFHEDATIFSTVGDAVLGGPIAWLYENMKQNGGITRLEYKINVVAITSTSAVAEVQLYQEAPAYEITDYLSLVKQPESGKWTIVSKVFHVYQYSIAKFDPEQA